MTTYTATLTTQNGHGELTLPDLPCNPRYVVHTTDSFVLLDSPHALADVQASGTVVAVYCRVGSAIHVQDADGTSAHCLYAHVPEDDAR